MVTSISWLERRANVSISGGSKLAAGASIAAPSWAVSAVVRQARRRTGWAVENV